MGLEVFFKHPEISEEIRDNGFSIRSLLSEADVDRLMESYLELCRFAAAPSASNSGPAAGAPIPVYGILPRRPLRRWYRPAWHNTST